MIINRLMLCAHWILQIIFILIANNTKIYTMQKYIDIENEETKKNSFALNYRDYYFSSYEFSSSIAHC